MPTYRVTIPVHTAVVYAVKAECLAAVYGEIDAGHGVLIQAATVEPGDFDDDESHWQIEIANRERNQPMSTRSTTHFRYGGVTQAIVYRHPDGYPSAMRPCFDDFFATLEKHTDDHRYADPSYLAAKWCVFLAHYFCLETGKRADWAHWKETAGTDPWPSTWLNFLSVGVVLADPGDIDYRYLVECDQQDESGRPVVRCERLDGAAVPAEGF